MNEHYFWIKDINGNIYRSDIFVLFRSERDILKDGFQWKVEGRLEWGFWVNLGHFDTEEKSIKYKDNVVENFSHVTY